MREAPRYGRGDGLRDARRHALAPHPLVGDLQAAIDDVEPVAQLLVGDDERRVREEVVPAHERVQAFARKCLPSAAISSLVPL